MSTATKTAKIDPLDKLIRKELERFARKKEAREAREQDEAEKATANVIRAKDHQTKKMIAELLAKAQKTLAEVCESPLLLRLLQCPWPTTTEKTEDDLPVLTLAGASAVVPFYDCPMIIYIGFLQPDAGTPKLALFTLSPNDRGVRDHTTSLPAIPEELEETLRALADTGTMVQSIVQALAS